MNELLRALGRIPHGQFILTAAFDGHRNGALVGWVQPCATHPPLIMLAMPTGVSVVPLIRDSRSFALCQIPASDRFLARKFATPPDHGDDPFDAIMTTCAPSGSPIVQRASMWFDCELIRHVDLEADHVLFVGALQAAGTIDESDPAIVWNGSIERSR